MFWQQISTDGSQVEAPDPWLNHANPWEVHRPDVSYLVRFYGHAERIGDSKAVCAMSLPLLFVLNAVSAADLEWWTGSYGRSLRCPHPWILHQEYKQLKALG